MKDIGKTIFLATSTILLTFCLITYPDQALNASTRGLNIWLEVVFPSLLPFFITAELLISFGIVTFLGVLFEPIMRPIFNVPGVGSFAWVMGMASGYPSGAKITARLREEKQLTRIEAERLLSFTNASSPLFIFGAIAIGFFHDPNLGILLAVCHYLGNFIVGICMRFYGKTKNKVEKQQSMRQNIFKQAFHKMHENRIKDKRPLGEIMGDAVLNSIKTLVVVGGFIVLFSVLTRMLFHVGILTVLAYVVKGLLTFVFLPIDLAIPLITGLFEITIGAQLVSNTHIDHFMAKIIVVSFILGFNGFSVQAQVSSIISKTDIKFSPYFISRLLHGAIASFLTVILYKPLYKRRGVSEVGELIGGDQIDDNIWIMVLNYLKQIGPVITIVMIGLAIIIQVLRYDKKMLQ